MMHSSQNVEAIGDQFAKAWDAHSEPPRLEDYLPPFDSPQRAAVLAALVKIDMERRIRRGERVRLEEMYLPRFAELKSESAHLLDLVIHEYLLRREEPGVSVEEYKERWPSFRDELARRLLTNPPAADDTFPTLPPSKPLPQPDDSKPTRPPSSEEPTPAHCMGDYQLLEELGRGGMGVVYRALDQKRGRHVALKTVQGLSSETIYRFKQEFRLRAELNHPNLVSLYELIATEENWFFTMELVEGNHFLHYVRAGGDALGSAASHPLTSPEQLQRLRHALRQLVEGVGSLHAAGRLHRDLKPSNVLVTRAGRVVLLDFGLVARLNAENLHQSTERHLLGTVAYMSPEQARSAPLSPASDWYSVGVMLYEALAGRLPFNGTFYQVLADKQQGDPPTPRSLASNVPEDLDALCMSLLARDPAARPSGRDCLRIIGAPSTASAPGIENRASDVALVGREEPLAAFADAYAACRKRHTVALFLSGASGIGKSSLLQKFLDQLRAEGEAVLLTGQCYEQESVPYKAFDGVIDALSRFLRRLSPLEAMALLPRDVASLLRVFPMLRRVDALRAVPQGHEAPDPQEVRQRAFASLRELLARLADRKPVVVCIDDLQWGDADSAALLTELVRPPDAPRFLFVGCHRSEESSSPFLTVLAESNRLLWSEVDRREVALDPLPREKAETLAAALLDGREAAHASAIAREAGGNPFFVHELVRHLQAETGRALTEGTIDLGKVLWERIERLPAEARELLAVTALAARPLPQDVACRAAGLPQGRIEELSLLRSLRLARGTGMSGDDLLVTYHDRIREAFRVHGSAAHTRHLHSRLAESLEAWGGADAEWLATHWEYAGDLKRAGEYYARAADRATETLAFDNAADLYQRALRMGLEETGLRRQVQRKRGEALANAGRGEDAAEVFQLLIVEASGLEAIELQRRVTGQLLISGHVEEGLKAAKALTHRLGMWFPRTAMGAAIGLLLTRAWLRLRGLKIRKSSREEVTDSELVRVDVLWTLGTVLGLLDPIRGAYFQAQYLARALRSGDPYRIARGLAITIGYNALAGSKARDKSSEIIALSKSLTQNINSPHADGLILLGLGAKCHLEGRYREAYRLFCDAERVFRTQCASLYWEMTSTRSFQLWSLVYLGEIAEMKRTVPSLMKEAQNRGDLHGIANVLSWSMPMLSMTHDTADEGVRELSEELHRWNQKGYFIQNTTALYMNSQLMIYLHKGIDGVRAAQDRYLSMNRARLNWMQIYRIGTWEILGRTQLAAAGETAKRSQYLGATERNAVRLDREKRPDARSFAALLRAGIAHYKGDLDKARKLLETALDGLVACELGLFAAAARRRLGQLIGGDEGKALVVEADAWMTAQGIRNPVRMTAVYAPGFDAP